MPPAFACPVPSVWSTYLSNPCMTSSVWLAGLASGQGSLLIFPQPHRLITLWGLHSFPVCPLHQTPSSQHWAWRLAGILSVFAKCMNASYFQIFERLSCGRRVNPNLSGSRGPIRTRGWKQQGGRNLVGFTYNIGSSQRWHVPYHWKGQDGPLKRVAIEEILFG